MRPITQAVVFLFAVFAVITPVIAADPVFHVDGKAIRGYDPVAYFTEEKAVEGSAAHTHEYQGATWQFVSAENREKFIADPQAYAPAYGGYCAWAVANNYTAPIDPDARSIRDGKLYLNYSKVVRARWGFDKSGNIEAADRNWPNLRGDG
jgi:YHS domain-containing protein